MARRDLSGAIDFAHLERYTAGDPALTSEVLGLFREQAAMWMRLLTPDAPAQAWRDAAHTLKGAALGVGAFDLAEACATAEQNADDEPGLRSHRLDAIRNTLDAALADVAAYLHEQAIQSLRSPSRSSSQRPNS